MCILGALAVRFCTLGRQPCISCNLGFPNLSPGGEFLLQQVLILCISLPVCCPVCSRVLLSTILAFLVYLREAFFLLSR